MKLIQCFKQLILLIFTACLSSGCVSIPKESVELSQEVEKGIIESQRSYNGLLNAYFSSKKQQVDEKIENQYLPEYLSNIQANLKNDGQPTTLSPQQLKDVLRDVIVERDKIHTDIENPRLLLLTISNEQYNQLLKANNGVKGLLQSMVNLNETTSSATQSIQNLSGGKLDFEQIESKFNDYLKNTGVASSKATSLYEIIKSILDSKEE